MTINTDLARERNLSAENIVMLEGLHKLRDDTHHLIKMAVAYENRSMAYALGQSLFALELEMQKLWGFEQNISMYKFWNVTGCDCPVADNNDRYPSGYYVINEGCWLHSKET